MNGFQLAHAFLFGAILSGSVSATSGFICIIAACLIAFLFEHFNLAVAIEAWLDSIPT